MASTLHRGTGHININLDDATLTTKSTALNSNGNTFSHAVTATHNGIGDINIDVLNSRLTTRGKHSYGIHAAAARTSSLLPARPGGFTASGNVHIDVRGGSTIRTHGENAHGIFAWHESGDGELRVDVREGASIQVDHANAYAVQLGSNTGANVNLVAEIGEDGYRRHIVTLNGALSGGRGILLAGGGSGGGKVFIGPKGTIDSTFGIAILANADTPGDPVIKPNLLVDMDLDGRRVRDVILNGSVIANTGLTTIVVNDVKLHDGADGVVLESDDTTPVSVPNGAWDVSIRKDGHLINGRNSNGWTFTDRAENTIISRDFLAEDFTQTDRPTCPEGQVGTPPDCTIPPPPMCPLGQVGTPPDCTIPPPPMCPLGQVGTPPDCTTMCPLGQVGTPPDCTTPPPPMCPLGQVGTPPDCTTPPAYVSIGTSGHATGLHHSAAAYVSIGTSGHAPGLHHSAAAYVSIGTSGHATGLHHSAAAYVSIGTSGHAPGLHHSAAA